jgi:hypothetical protein
LVEGPSGVDHNAGIMLGTLHRTMGRSGIIAGFGAACLLALGCGQIDTTVGAELPRDSSAPPVVTSLYLEAENGKLVGFTIESDPTASGGKYILPPPNEVSLATPGDASAEYAFVLGQAGTYLLWGRLRAPGAENNAFFVTMDDGGTVRWQLSTGVVWYWGAITDKTQYTVPVQYALDAGIHHLVFQNSQPLVGLDRLYVTVPGDVPPGNDTPCSPPNSIQVVDGGCSPSCGSHGTTTCGPGCVGQTPLDSYDCLVCCFALDGGAPDAADAGPLDSGGD